MVLVQRVTQLPGVGVEAEIGVAGDLVQIVADTVQSGKGLNKRAMLYGAAMAGAGASMVQACRAGKSTDGKTGAQSPILIARILVVRHAERDNARPLPLVTSFRHPPSEMKGSKAPPWSVQAEMPAGGSGVATP
ncbi:hypothetical protein L6Q21_08630 [Sandaracinobacter sp. RS1-74]|nr:hypothetical protein [Sandaracinobacteroides sayramensis]MCG2841046.1 hypothetical protein [Sandaracinobacteroides sayramensis]